MSVQVRDHLMQHGDADNRRDSRRRLTVGARENCRTVRVRRGRGEVAVVPSDCMAEIGGESLTKCPVCRYDLTGLPAHHRCPECGFEYDETKVVWYGSRKWWITTILWFSLLWVLAGVVVCFSSLIQPPIPPRERIVPILFGFAAAWMVAEWHWSRPFVAMTKRGLVYRDRGRHNTKTIGWSAFWMPAPGTRMAIPPWQASAAPVPTTFLGQARRALWRERGLFHTVNRIYLPPTHPQLPSPPWIELPLRGMSRRQKREVMNAIWTKWRSAQPLLPEL